jgi:hypothetical protein
MGRNVSPVKYELGFYITLTGWTLHWRSHMSPVKYEICFYIPEDGILHSHRRENLKSYIQRICLKCTNGCKTNRIGNVI